MSFVGLVTRKDKPTGMKLRAKIVTPSGRKYAYQEFPCMVKSNGLSDLACCILDLNATVAGLGEKNLSSISTNITSAMPANGANGTTITYAYESDTMDSIYNYISEDGVIKKRPNYGEQGITGSIIITVSKGTESVTSKLTIMISPYTVDEIFANAQSLIEWESIRGENAIETNDATSGTKNVKTNLNLIKNINVDGSSVPLTITWSVVDSAQNYAEASGLFTGPRISNDGIVSRPSYTNAYRMHVSGNSGFSSTIVSGTVPCIRISGISLTATISMEGAERTVSKTFNLSTLSKYLTNSEVALYLSNNIKATVLTNNVSYAPMDSSVSTFVTLSETETSKIYDISVPMNTVGFGSAQSLGLSTISAGATCSIMDFEDVSIPKNYSTDITSGPIANSDSGVMITSFDLSKAHNLNEQAKKFTIMCTIDVWAYSANGLTLGGESSTSKVYWKFNMATMA